MRQPTGKQTSLPQEHYGMMTLEDHNTPTAIRKQSTICSSQTEMSLVLSSCRKDEDDSELRSMRVRRKKKPYVVPLYPSNYITKER